MWHHSNFCKWIHGAFILFDHALGTNVKATGIVVLYYSDGALIKFGSSGLSVLFCIQKFRAFNFMSTFVSLINQKR